MAKLALKLVAPAQFYVEEGEFWNGEDRNSHSLHFAISYPESFSPELANFFIKKYSGADEVVLDPFCGRGTVPLEAVLNNRIAVASDIHPLAMTITSAKLDPVDLVEVALFIQSINFNKPISLDHYQEYFEPFFELDTFRELTNLRNFLLSNRSPVSRFLQLVALSILHGHTAGYLSAYTLPQVSVAPSHQRHLNDKRGKLPEYRAVAPRLLRKAGAVLRDGDVVRMRQRQSENKIGLSDSRNLSFVKNGSVNLVVTAPPRPFVKSAVNDLWLRSWFMGLTKQERERLASEAISELDLPQWLDFMNETLFELARVVKSGGRLVMDLKEVSDGKVVHQLDNILGDFINSHLSNFWETECLYVNKATIPQLAKKFREGEDCAKTSRVLVIRRR